MAMLYAKKILEHQINPATGKEWCLDDVPERWHDAVKKIIDG